ncbi:peptidoglycan-binding domain-containing protein [Dactylosporangium sp. CA-139114]|uniref:peptidoglycan-binding domain-containing protein n=1 Tax=Dactylosporangium sp. CA-139114 TaxID=3239931 RepID=UPI003D96D9B6
MRKNLATLVAVIAAFSVSGLAVSTTPASASASSGYISGSGDWTDDWGDEGLLSTSSYAHSNVAAMWQAILWADGQSDYFASIDCRFGSKTNAATESWQDFHRLSADGIVGGQTLTTAARYLRGPAPGTSGYLTLTYIGHWLGGSASSDETGRYVTFTRNTSGQWGMYVGSDHHLLSYTSANFNQCA